MLYWKYKAYDADGQRKEGAIAGDDPQLLVLEVRQRGLQIYDMVTVSYKEYRRVKSMNKSVGRLQALKSRLSNGVAAKEQKEPVSLPPASPDYEVVHRAWVLRRKAAVSSMISRLILLLVAAVIGLVTYYIMR